MKTAYHILGVIIVTVLWWMIYWVAIGQDLNAFARTIIPTLSILSLVPTIIIALLAAIVTRFILKRRLSAFPKMLWGILFFSIISATLLMSVLNG